MIEKIQFLPPKRQRWVRAVALSMEGPSHRYEEEPVWVPLIALVAIIWALVGIFA